MNIQISGPYCPVSSYLRGKLTSEWIPSEDTDIRATFARVSPYFESGYDETDRDHHLAFANGFKS